MAKLSEIKTDLDKQLDGVWFPYERGIEVKIACARNPEFKRAMRKIEKQGRRRKKSLEEMIEDDRELIVPLIARHIMKDWRNIDDEGGEPIAFSEEKAVEFLSDPALEDFYIFVMASASDVERFKQREFEETAGN